MALDLVRIERRMRRAYEFGRIKYAAQASVPFLSLAGVALYASSQRWLDFVLAASLGATILAYLWRGKLEANALRSGLVAGLYPLVLALVANSVGPGCGHGSPLSLCALACALGGALTARHLTYYAANETRRALTFGLALLPAFLLGALGCGCIGFTGVLAMALAIMLVSLPAVVRWA